MRNVVAIGESIATYHDVSFCFSIIGMSLNSPEIHHVVGLAIDVRSARLEGLCWIVVRKAPDKGLFWYLVHSKLLAASTGQRRECSTHAQKKT